MIKSILKNLEDPSISFMGPYVTLLNVTGLFIPKEGRKRHVYILINTMVFIFGPAMIIDLWDVKSNRVLLLNNLKTSMLAWITIAKAGTFLSWQKHWRDIINYVNKADEEQKRSNDKENQKIIRETMEFSRNMSYSYWGLSAVTVAALIVAPILKYALSPTYRERAKNGEEDYLPVASSWVPWDKSNLTGYIAVSTYQTFCALCGSSWFASYDTNAVAVMTFFKREIQLLRRDSAKIFGSVDSPVEVREIGKRIMECHIRHKELTKYAKVFNSCLSPIMTLYVIVCSIMLCVTSYQITIEKNAMQRILTAEYLVFGISQLFLYCWHSNVVLFSSEKLHLGPYESLWWKHKAYRKSILILMIQFNKKIVFTAPPFGNVSMFTFISILKGAYSYYTVLCQSSNEL